MPDSKDKLIAAERSSAAEAANRLLAALGWKSGGLASAAIEIVEQRDALLALVKGFVEDLSRERLYSKSGIRLDLGELIGAGRVAIAKVEGGSNAEAVG